MIRIMTLKLTEGTLKQYLMMKVAACNLNLSNLTFFVNSLYPRRCDYVSCISPK